MTKLKEAFTKAGNDADLVNVGSWAATFLSSLEDSGFTIVPIKATESMILAGASIGPCDALSRAKIAWEVMVAERQRLDDGTDVLKIAQRPLNVQRDES